MANIGVVFVGVMALLILVVGATVAYVPENSTTTQIAYSQQSTGETGSAEGLVLGATLNASVIPQGKAISLQIWERNSLNVQNNVTAASNWLYGNLVLGPCGTMNFPFGFEVLSGYYSAGSPGLETTHALQLYEPGAYECPAILSGITSYAFYPTSDHASVVGSCTPEPCFTGEMNFTSVFRGYWNGSSFYNLPTGVYTVVVGDEWGAAVFQYFTVFSNGSQETVLLPAGTDIVVSSSYDCVAGHFQLQFESQRESFLVGGFVTRNPGASLFVATVKEALNVTQGHPSHWLYTTGLQNSTSFRIPVPQGTYVLWIEGADLNCGAKVVMPLEALTQVNITQSIGLTGG